MHHNFKALLFGLTSFVCTQIAGVLYVGHALPTVEPTVRFALVEEFDKQAIFQTSTIDRPDYQSLTKVTPTDPIDKVPLPFPQPRPAPAAPSL